jgi:hypothetical protein
VLRVSFQVFNFIQTTQPTSILCWRSSLTASDRCACRKLDSDMMVVQSAEDRLGKDAPDGLGVPREQRILVQRRCVSALRRNSSRSISARGVKVLLAEHHDMINVLPPDQADQPLCYVRSVTPIELRVTPAVPQNWRSPDSGAGPWSVGNAGLRVPRSSTPRRHGAALGSRNVSHLGPSL